MLLQPAPALAVVVMGVSGTGKSMVATGIAEALGLACIDGDDLHSAESVAKMRAGTALTTEDRLPWLARIGQCLREPAAGSAGVVVSCSALRRDYRDRLRAAAPGVVFVFLDGPAALIGERLRQRQHHYMPAGLLESQLQSLERPGDDEPDVRAVDIAAAPAEVVAHAVRAVRALAPTPSPPETLP